MSRIPATVVAEVHERAAGHCEGCTWPLRGVVALHHRLPLSAGGPNTAVNLMLVHGECHNVAPGSIHQNPARSYRLGHLVRRGSDPAAIPVVAEPRLRELRA